jgi:hypothetical protein
MVRCSQARTAVLKRKGLEKTKSTTKAEATAQRFRFLENQLHSNKPATQVMGLSRKISNLDRIKNMLSAWG